MPKILWCISIDSPAFNRGISYCSDWGKKIPPPLISEVISIFVISSLPMLIIEKDSPIPPSIFIMFIIINSSKGLMATYLNF